MSQNNRRINKNNGRINENNEKINENNGRINENNGRINENNRKINENNGRINENNGRINENNGRINENNGRINENNGKMALNKFATDVLNKYLLSEKQIIQVHKEIKKKSINEDFNYLLKAMDPAIIYDNINKLNILDKSKISRRGKQVIGTLGNIGATIKSASHSAESLAFLPIIAALPVKPSKENVKNYRNQITKPVTNMSFRPRVTHLLSRLNLRTLRNFIYIFNIMHSFYKISDNLLFLSISYIYDLLSKIKDSKFFIQDRESNPRYLFFTSLIKVYFTGSHHTKVGFERECKRIYEYIDSLHSLSPNNIIYNPLHQSVGGTKHKKTVSKKVTKTSKK
jgi:hypothetical protein